MNFAEHVKVRKEKFGAVIFDTLREKIFVTNEPGVQILQLIEEGKDLIGLTRILVNSYNQSPELIQKDVSNFVEQLKKNNLIKNGD